MRIRETVEIKATQAPNIEKTADNLWDTSDSPIPKERIMAPRKINMMEKFSRVSDLSFPFNLPSHIPSTFFNFFHLF